MNARTAFSLGEGPAGSSESRAALLGRLVLALTAACYALTRLGWATGASIALAASIFAILDIVRFFWLARVRYAVFTESIVIILQIAAIADLFLVPAPVGFGSDLAARIAFDTPLLVLLMCFLVSNAVASRPALVWVSGGAIIGLWVVLWRFVVSDPHMLTQSGLHMAQYKTALALLTETNGPYYFNFGNWLKGGIMSCALITCALGLVLYRTRRLASESTLQEVRRLALGAFFSPQLVEIILRARDQGYAPNERQIAVLDCDLVGFTKLAETMQPNQIAAGLRLYRSVVEEAVFEHDGAILSHIGDGAITLFGLSNRNDDAATRAVSCALTIMRRWPSAANALFKSEVPRLAIGIDHGPTIVGLVGRDRSLSLLAVGPVIDGASFLQHATRDAGTQVLISDGTHSILGATLDNVTFQPCTVGVRAWRLAGSNHLL